MDLSKRRNHILRVEPTHTYTAERIPFDTDYVGESNSVFVFSCLSSQLKPCVRFDSGQKLDAHQLFRTIVGKLQKVHASAGALRIKKREPEQEKMSCRERRTIKRVSQ